ncbi:malto-oligosyltrehalose synthase [Acidomonas methanolica]|uniref:malto-oligosyltrehalose synthase n=1 Tax=Acidomonas methanolica TaxID=437 RepID=UPI002119BE73|nr:malto-oligosyltrehalose synthase [Acidomonas methanolica]MCQ9155638.1 malto-oligosyltrehalose synthase [Acidomonas methanolica]
MTTTPDAPRPEPQIPALRATARLQFHRHFTLHDAAKIVPYFAALGISHLYASPLLAATPGSTHGYDTADCQRLDPDRGGEEGLRALVAALRAHEMGLILDIVPNHMGVGPHNRWWQDVLAHGLQSRYARFFDIDWTPPDPALREKILLPVLGAPLDEVLDKGEIALHFAPRLGGFMLHYGDHRFPVAPDDTRQILAVAAADAPAHSLAEWFESSAGADAQAKVSAVFAQGTPVGRAHLAELLDRQHYRLAWWRTGDDRLNWRRFFDVTSLAALRMEDEAVFDETHALIFDLYRDGLIDGVRIDHVDGLARPAEYCRRLRERLEALRAARPAGLRAPPTIHVEKILEETESLPEIWDVTGTTGYDFLDQVSLVLHDPEASLPLTAFWERFGPSAYRTVQRAARLEKMESSFYGETNRLIDLLAEAAERLAPGRDFTRHAIATVLEAILLGFPVYRSYFADRLPPDAQKTDRRVLAHAVIDARRHLPPYQRALLGWIHDLLRGDLAGLEPEAWREIITRFEHLTAPLTAKSGEDTAFYRYNRLLSRNDVGCDPSRIAATPDWFHERMQARLNAFPHALLATATHDHKRGEDARARLMLLSEAKAAWPETAESWFALNAAHRAKLADGLAPSRADELFIYQTLIAAWPLHEAETAALPDRLWAYWQKALREAARHTSWSLPDEAYETACRAFLAALLDTNGPFRPELERFVARLAPAAALNGLAQTLLRVTVPGVPDLYQGTEFWDHSLVDPDNRRPVDFDAREKALAETLPFAALAASWRNGAIKQRLIATVLQHRKAYPDLFAAGRYTPLPAIGDLAEHVLAFRRDHEDQSLLVIAPRLPLALSPDDALSTPRTAWNGTRLAVEGRWKSLLDETVYEPGESLAEWGRILPLDVLVPDSMATDSLGTGDRVPA